MNFYTPLIEMTLLSFSKTEIRTYSSNRKHPKIIVHDTISFKSKNYSVQISSYF